MVAFFVILTIIGFILVDSIVQWAEARQGRALKQAAPRPTVVPALALETVTVPAGLFLDEGHTWVRLEPSGRTFIGMDEFARRAIGRVDAVELPKVGSVVRRGDPLFAIVQNGRRAIFRAPLTGVVSAVNEGFARLPETGRRDPYEEGWVCALKPMDLAAHLRHLFVAEEARAWLRWEIERFKEFLTQHPMLQPAFGQVLQDGGQWAEGILEGLDEASWEEFARTFLRSPRPSAE
jgi:glycine cleavage system H lipoate-binding protein